MNIVSENDAYTWRLHDGYYTNGLFINLYYEPSVFDQKITTAALKKAIGFYQAGQLMFTPGSVYDTAIKQIDRPYAGYLFFQKGYDIFFPNAGVLEFSASLGMTGKASLVQQAQDIIHNLGGFVHFNGWKYQVKGGPGIDLQAKYHHELWRVGKLSSIMATTQVSLGSTFTNASLGMNLKLGQFNSNWASSFYHSSIGNPVTAGSKRELFFYFPPRFVYEAFNATLQGRLFGTNAGSVLSEPNHYFYMHELGLVCSQNRWTLRTVYFYRQKEAKGMRNNERYGSFSVSYRFGQ